MLDTGYGCIQHFPQYLIICPVKHLDPAGRVIRRVTVRLIGQVTNLPLLCGNAQNTPEAWFAPTPLPAGPAY